MFSIKGSVVYSASVHHNQSSPIPHAEEEFSLPEMLVPNANKLILRFLGFLEIRNRQSWIDIRVIKSLIYFTPAQSCLKNIHTSSIIAAREYVRLFLHISILITSEQLIKIIYHSLEQHGF